MTELDDLGAFVTEVPTWRALIVPTLRAFESPGPLHRKDLFDRAADFAGLTSDARAERLSSGGLRYERGMGWVLTNAMRRAGLIAHSEPPMRSRQRESAGLYATRVR